MITNDNLDNEYQGPLGGVCRVYKFPSGWGVSLINAAMAHRYFYAWEAAVINPDGKLDYSTELTSDVEVFMSDEEANDFIKRAAETLGKS